MISLVSQEKIVLNIDTSENRFNLGNVLAYSDSISKAQEIDAEMTFGESLSRVPDTVDLFIRQGIIAGRVSSRASWYNEGTRTYMIRYNSIEL